MDGLDQKATGTEDLASLRHFLGVILEEDDMKEEFTQRKIFFLFFLVFEGFFWMVWGGGLLEENDIIGRGSPMRKPLLSSLPFFFAVGFVVELRLYHEKVEES